MLESYALLKCGASPAPPAESEASLADKNRRVGDRFKFCADTTCPQKQDLLDLTHDGKKTSFLLMLMWNAIQEPANRVQWPPESRVEAP